MNIARLSGRPIHINVILGSDYIPISGLFLCKNKTYVNRNVGFVKYVNDRFGLSTACNANSAELSRTISGLNATTKIKQSRQRHTKGATRPPEHRHQCDLAECSSMYATREKKTRKTVPYTNTPYTLEYIMEYNIISIKKKQHYFRSYKKNKKRPLPKTHAHSCVDMARAPL